MPTVFHDYLTAFEAALVLEQRTGVHHEVRDFDGLAFYVIRNNEA